MPVRFKTNVTEPLPKNTEDISTESHLLWVVEAAQAVNQAETGWRDFTEALENRGLFMLDNDQNQIIFCLPQGRSRNQDQNTQQLRAMIQASAEGRLFVRNHETGLLMQLRAKTLTDQNCELELSEPVSEIPGVQDLIPALQAPEAPSIWARIAAWFAPNSKYGQKVAAYDSYVAGIVKLPEEQVDSERDMIDELGGRHQEEEKVVADSREAQQQENELQQENEQQKELPKENEQPANKQENEHPTFGLKKYSKKVLENCFVRMTYSQKAANDAQKSIPETSPVRFDGKELGLLVVMAMASPELSFTSKKSGNKHVSNPDTTYKSFVGSHLVQGNPLSPETKAFTMVAQRLVGAALKQAATGNYEKLAKIIADGLTHNNKFLQSQKELSDLYTGCAEMGQMMIKLMDKNDDLKKAVMDQLGADTKQIHIANTAKNISDFRVDAMKTYQEMMKTINLFVDSDIKDSKGKVIGQKHTPIVQYEVTDIAKVALLSKIEMDMNFGKINLEDSQFANPDEAKNIVKDYGTSDVLNAFQWDANRGALLQNPKKMMDLFDAATNDMGGALDIKKFEREQGLDKDAQYNDLYNYNEQVIGKQDIDIQKIFG